MLGLIPAATLARYPNPERIERAVARRWSIDPARVVVTAGADDGLDRACRAFLRERPELVSVDPTFEMIPRFASLAGGRMVSIPHVEGPAPVEALAGAVGSETGLVAVVSPHNPTGAVTPADRLLALARALPDPVRLVVDLAYIEFADEDPTPALLERPRVLVVRTLSKAWGLAGLRVGFALGSLEDVERLRASGAPFPLAGPSLWLAEAALAADRRVTAPYVRAVRQERAALARLLRSFGARPLDGEANFVLARVDAPERIRAALAGLRIHVRTFGHLPDMLRITLPGDADAFERLCAALRSTLGPGGAR